LSYAIRMHPWSRLPYQPAAPARDASSLLARRAGLQQTLDDRVRHIFPLPAETHRIAVIKQQAQVRMARESGTGEDVELKAGLLAKAGPMDPFAAAELQCHRLPRSLLGFQHFGLKR